MKPASVIALCTRQHQTLVSHNWYFNLFSQFLDKWLHNKFGHVPHTIIQRFKLPGVVYFMVSSRKKQENVNFRFYDMYLYKVSLMFIVCFCYMEQLLFYQLIS